MANKFQIDITARDKTAEALKSVNDNFAKLTKGTGLEKAAKGFASIEGRGRAFGGIARSILNMGDASRLAGGGVAEAAGGLAELGGVAGITGLAVGGIGVGLGVAAEAAFKFESSFTKAGAQAGRFADVIGESAQQLQLYELAGKRFGVTADAMAGALQGIGNAMQDAASGRNQGALQLMNKLGIRVHYLKNGAVDSARGLDDLAAAMARQGPQTRQMIANQFGVTGAMNFMIATARERERALDEAARSGEVRNAAQIASDRRFQVSVAALDEQWHGLLNAFSQNLVIPWLQPAIDKFAHLEGLLSLLLRGKATMDWSGLITPNAPAGGGSAAAAGTAGAPTASDGRTGGGLRRNNPGNIRNGPHGFMSYATPEEGLAAMGRQLRRYETHYGLDTIRGIVSRWAPPGDHNDTEAYIHNVARRTGFQTQQHLDLNDPAVLAKLEAAMIVQEHGRNPYSRDQLLASAGGGVNGKVHVEVHVKGTHPGTVVTASAQGAGVTTSARISPSMAGAAI